MSATVRDLCAEIRNALVPVACAEGVNAAERATLHESARRIVAAVEEIALRDAESRALEPAWRMLKCECGAVFEVRSSRGVCPRCLLACG